MRKKYALLFLIFLGLAACQSEKEVKEIIRPVKTAEVGTQADLHKEFSAIVEPVDYVNLAFRVGGQVISLPVMEGQKVSKGKIIAVIDTRELQLQLAADKSVYETAKSQLERNRRLLARQVISQQEFEISESNYQRAKSAYEHSQNNLKDTRLVAPFDGSVEKRYVENFQRVHSGEAIVRLVNTSKLRIRFTIPDNYLPLLRTKKQSFEVKFDAYKGKVFKAGLEEYLDVSADGTGIPVSIKIDDPSFNKKIYEVKPGFTCKVSMRSNVSSIMDSDYINIPLSAVIGESNSNDRFVWVVDNDKVSKRKITIESPTGEANVLVSEGLKSGEIIVTAGVHQLVEGQRVKVLK